MAACAPGTRARRPRPPGGRRAAPASGSRAAPASCGHRLELSEPRRRDAHDLALEDTCELGGHAILQLAHVLLAVELPPDRGHLAVIDSAGHDPLEWLQVVVHVHGEAAR